MTKRCPYCGEEIMATAKKCRFCGEWLEDTKAEKILEIVSFLEENAEKRERRQKSEVAAASVSEQPVDAKGEAEQPETAKKPKNNDVENDTTPWYITVQIIITIIGGWIWVIKVNEGKVYFWSVVYTLWFIVLFAKGLGSPIKGLLKLLVLFFTTGVGVAGIGVLLEKYHILSDPKPIMWCLIVFSLVANVYAYIRFWKQRRAVKALE